MTKDILTPRQKEMVCNALGHDPARPQSGGYRNRYIPPEDGATPDIEQLVKLGAMRWYKQGTKMQRLFVTAQGASLAGCWQAYKKFAMSDDAVVHIYKSDEEITIHRMDPESANNQVRLVCGKGLATPVDGRLQIAKYSPRWQYVTCDECLAKKPEIGTKAGVRERIHWRLSALAGLAGACRTKSLSYVSTDPADVTCPKCIDGWNARREGRHP